MQQSGNNSSRIASWFTLLLGYVLETPQFYCLSAFFCLFSMTQLIGFVIKLIAALM